MRVECLYILNATQNPCSNADALRFDDRLSTLVHWCVLLCLGWLTSDVLNFWCKETRRCKSAVELRNKCTRWADWIAAEPPGQNSAKPTGHEAVDIEKEQVCRWSCFLLCRDDAWSADCDLIQTPLATKQPTLLCSGVSIQGSPQPDKGGGRDKRGYEFSWQNKVGCVWPVQCKSAHRNTLGCVLCFREEKTIVWMQTNWCFGKSSACVARNLVASSIQYVQARHMRPHKQEPLWLGQRNCVCQIYSVRESPLPNVVLVVICLLLATVSAKKKTPNVPSRLK